MKKSAYLNVSMLTGFFCAVMILLSWASLSVQLDRDRNRSSSGRENHSDDTRPIRWPRDASTL